MMNSQHKTNERGGWIHVEECCVDNSLLALPETRSRKSEPVVMEQMAVFVGLVWRISRVLPKVHTISVSSIA